MAKGYYQKQYENLFSKPASSKSTTSNIVGNKVGNLKTRLKAGGVSSDKVEDNRNFIEKALNLTPDQNIIFDLFELINRPQQAVFGAVENAQQGKSALEGLKEGFTGDKDTQFKQILTNAGMSDREGKLDLSDVLGFAGDVILDPMDLAIFPVSTGAKAAKAGVNAVDTVSDVAKAADAVNDTTKLVSGTDLVFRGIGKGLKGTAKVADTGIESALKAIDKSKGIDYINPLSKTAENLGKVVADGTNAAGKLETYKSAKNVVSTLFNKTLPDSVKTVMRTNNANSIKTAAELNPIYKNMDDAITDYATKYAAKSGITDADGIAKIKDDVSVALGNMLEKEGRKTTMTVKDAIKQGIDGKLSAKTLDDKGMEILKGLEDSVNGADRSIYLNHKIVDGKLVLNDDWKLLGKAQNVKQEDKLRRFLTKKYGEGKKDYIEKVIKDIKETALDDGVLNGTINKLPSYSDESIKYFDDIYKKYGDDEFNILKEQSKDLFRKANEVIDKNFGTNMVGKYKDSTGYMRHVYNKDNFDYYNKSGFLNNGDIVAKGNKSILNERMYDMTAREANDMFKDVVNKNLKDVDINNADDITKMSYKKAKEVGDLFSENILTSFNDYLRSVPKLAEESKLLDEVLVKATFGDFDELKNLNKQIGSAQRVGNDNLVKELYKKRDAILENGNMKILTKGDSKVPFGYTKIGSSELKSITSKIDEMSKQLNIPELESISKKIKGKEDVIAINNDLIRLIDVNTNKKELNGLARMYDNYLNFFKKNKVLSPTFQLNNVIGNTSNIYLSGISPTKMAQLYPDASKIINNGNDLLVKVANNGIESLTKDEKRMYQIYDAFIKEGFGSADTAMDLADLPEGLRKYFDGTKKFKDMSKAEKVRDFLPYMNNKMNNYMDTTSRLVTFMEGMNNPKYLDNLGVKSAGDAVRKVNFDPSDLTQFEKDTMKKIIPFYTFTKKNLAFQMSNLGQNGSRYNKMMKAYDSLLKSATDDNEENVQDWMKNNMYIPIPGLGKDGSYKVLRGALPFGNFIEAASDPLGTVVNTVSPLAKMPIELVTNTSSFSGLPIEKFADEKSKNIPFMSKKGEYLLGNLTGLDVPAKVATRLFTGEGDNIIDKIGSGLGKSVTIDGDIEADKLSKMYDELDRLEALMQQYKQKGYEFSTMNELKKSLNNNTIDKISSKLNKLNGIKDNPYMNITK